MQTIQRELWRRQNPVRRIRNQRSAYVRFWLITDIDERSDYIRFTPESGHEITDVRFLLITSVIGGKPDIIRVGVFVRL